MCVLRNKTETCYDKFMAISQREKDTKKMLSTIVIGTQVVAQLVAPVIIFLLLGLWLDKNLHTTPWCLITGVIIGFIISIWNTFKLTAKL
jgi:F0F1-type ATP synthase assembly protein I